MKVAPGLNLTFSWRRALGVTRLRRKMAKATGVPTTRSGLARKIGRGILGLFGLSVLLSASPAAAGSVPGFDGVKEGRESVMVPLAIYGAGAALDATMTIRCRRDNPACSEIGLAFPLLPNSDAGVVAAKAGLALGLTFLDRRCKSVAVRWAMRVASTGLSAYLAVRADRVWRRR